MKTAQKIAGIFLFIYLFIIFIFAEACSHPVY